MSLAWLSFPTRIPSQPQAASQLRPVVHYVQGSYFALSRSLAVAHRNFTALTRNIALLLLFPPPPPRPLPCPHSAIANKNATFHARHATPRHATTTTERSLGGDDATTLKGIVEKTPATLLPSSHSFSLSPTALPVCHQVAGFLRFVRDWCHSLNPLPPPSPPPPRSLPPAPSLYQLGGRKRGGKKEGRDRYKCRLLGQREREGEK